MLQLVEVAIEILSNVLWIFYSEKKIAHKSHERNIEEATNKF